MFLRVGDDLLGRMRTPSERWFFRGGKYLVSKLDRAIYSFCEEVRFRAQSDIFPGQPMDTTAGVSGLAKLWLDSIAPSEDDEKLYLHEEAERRQGPKTTDRGEKRDKKESEKDSEKTRDSSMGDAKARRPASEAAGTGPKSAGARTLGRFCARAVGQILDAKYDGDSMACTMEHCHFPHLSAADLKKITKTDFLAQVESLRMNATMRKALSDAASRYGGFKGN